VIAKTLACLLTRGGVEDLADRGGDHRLLGAGAVAEHVAQEMDGAPLPGTSEDRGDRVLQALMGIGDAQAHAAQAT